MTTTTRYRVPTVYQDVKVRLDDFDDEDIVEYLRYRGYAVGGSSMPPMDDEAGGPVPGEGPLVLESDDLSRIAMLAYCGQREHARDFLCDIVSQWIGRRL